MRKHQAPTTASARWTRWTATSTAPRPGLGRGSSRWGEERLPQRPGLAARPDRDHRLHDGLRHHGHRAGLLAGQVQEARRRRVDADRQPDDPAGAAKLGYAEETVEAIVEHIADKGHVIDAPGLRPEHYEIFDCAMGAAHRPDGSRADDGGGPAVPLRRHLQDGQPARVGDRGGDRGGLPPGWKLGLKALAVYRDNCQVGQPLSDAKADKADTAVEGAGGRRSSKYRPVRQRLPKRRMSQTTSFAVGGAEGTSPPARMTTAGSARSSSSSASRVRPWPG